MNVPNHHYKNPEATAAAIVNGWQLTGDAARQDEDGFIWLVDRKKTRSRLSVRVFSIFEANDRLCLRR